MKNKEKVSKFNWEDFTSKVLDNSKRKYGKKKFGELYYSNALCGEAGELANYIKKRARGDKKPPTNKICGKEIADVIMYSIHLANNMGIDLPKALTAKLKEVQKRKVK